MAKYKKRSDGRYYTKIQIGRDPETGKAIRKNIYGRTIAELESKKSELTYHLDKGTYADDEGLTLLQWSRKWLEIYKTNNAESTYNNYKNSIEKHIAEIGDIQLKDLKKSDIQVLINSRIGKRETQRMIKLTLNQILEAAIDDGLVYKNVCRNIEIPNDFIKKKTEKRALTKTEEKAIKNNCNFTLKEKSFIFILYYCGLRRSEALALTKNDIDFKNNEIRITKSLYLADSNSYVKKPKTSSGIRILPMPTPLAECLKVYIKNLDNIYLFTSPKGGLMTKISFRRFWKSIYEKINIACGGVNAIKETEKQKATICYDAIRGLTPHIFRHNYATMLYYAGIDLKEAQRLLGHADIKTLLQVYTHADSEKGNTNEKIRQFIS